MRLIRRILLWRARRHYRAIDRLEKWVGFDLRVLEMRKNFAAETVGRIQEFHKRAGWSRGRRRSFQRDVARGK